MSEHVHSGVGGNSPLQERTDSDRNDNDEEVDGLEENAYGKIPEVTNYIQPWAKWDSGTVEKLTKEVQDEGRELDNIASSEDFQSNAQERAGIDDPDPRCSAKACRLAGLVIGVPAGLGTLAVIILAIAGVFNAAKKMEDSTTTPTDPEDPPTRRSRMIPPTLPARRGSMTRWQRRPGTPTASRSGWRTRSRSTSSRPGWRSRRKLLPMC